MNSKKSESVGTRARLVASTVGAVALGLIAPSAHAAITSNVLTDVQATFNTTQSMGEAASVVAATLALISVAVSFIWRARG